MLLEYNANTNAQSTGGFTPLHLSCQDGHADMVYLLLANQADPNIPSKCHLTPLHLCAQEDRVKCAEALVNKNANIDAQTLVRKSFPFFKKISYFEYIRLLMHHEF
jgi:ankyrin